MKLSATQAEQFSPTCTNENGVAIGHQAAWEAVELANGVQEQHCNFVSYEMLGKRTEMGTLRISINNDHDCCETLGNW